MSTDYETVEYLALVQKREELAQRREMEERKLNAMRDRTEQLMRERANELYARQKFEADKIQHQTASQLEIERYRQNAETQRTYYKGNIDLELEKARHYSAWHIEKLRQEGELQSEQIKAENALELQSNAHHDRMNELSMNFSLSMFQKTLETRENRTKSLLKHLEKRSELRADVFKMLVAHLLSQSSESESSPDAVDEILKQWKTG